MERGRTLGIAIGILGPIFVAAALVGVRDDIVSTNTALILVLVVVLAAITGGWQAGAVGAVSAALSFDFFHTEPYLSLKIESGNDVETALLLLIVGISVGLLAGRAQSARLAARRGSGEIVRIHRVVDLAASGAPAELVLEAAQEELRSLFGLRACRFEAPPFIPPLARIEHTGAISGVHERHFAVAGLELPREGVELPVMARGQQVGRFVLDPEPGVGFGRDAMLVAIAIADQVGAALATPSHA